MYRKQRLLVVCVYQQRLCGVAHSGADGRAVIAADAPSVLVADSRADGRADVAANPNGHALFVSDGRADVAPDARADDGATDAGADAESHAHADRRGGARHRGHHV